jgi:hypothetical protein
MTLYFREVGRDVTMRLRGSIDTSVFAESPGNASLSGGAGSFSHSGYFTATSGSAEGTGNQTTVISAAVQGIAFRFLNDAALMSVGTYPPLQLSSKVLTNAPPFWFGFLDITQTTGTPGALRDGVYLPFGYASNEFISLDYTARNQSFANLGFARGDRWGVSFTNGSGGTQEIIFHAAPEPSALGLSVLAVTACSRRRCLASARHGRTSSTARSPT